MTRANTRTDEQVSGSADAAQPPQNPRRSPLVVYSLKRIARRDPSFDPLKPIGRSSFLVWALVLCVSGLGAYLGRDLVNLDFIRELIAPALADFFRNDRSRAALMAEIEAHPQSVIIWGLTIAGVVSALAALYYATLYLFLVHLRDLAVDAVRALAMASRRAAKRLAASASRTYERLKDRASPARAHGRPPRLS